MKILHILLQDYMIGRIDEISLKAEADSQGNKSIAARSSTRTKGEVI
jgi:hypothetical protein